METLEESLKFRQWKKSLDEEGIILESVEERATIRKPKGDILFSLIESQALTPDGNKLPSITLLRGVFVSVLTVLHEKETGHRYLLLVKQRRVANGAYFYEHPAGMCDSEANPLAVAIKELHEETGLIVDPSKLVSLNSELLYSSPGLLDEGGHFFYVDLNMSADEIAALHEKPTGAEDESENIFLYVAEVTEAMQITKSAIALLHIYLYLDKIS